MAGSVPVIDRARLDAIVREAGRIALSRWPGHGHSLESWDKEPGSPVSAADLEVDEFLKRELGRLLPAAGWLSEETADAPERLEGGLIWLVDPIDGTRDFIRGRAGWCVSVALVSAGRPLFGLLSAPAREEFWLAEAGKGAWRNNRRLYASRRTQLPGARVPAEAVPHIDADLVPVARPNSIALRMAMVAAGDADLLATFRWGADWDIAAAVLIAREAGATVTDALGKKIRFNTPRGESFGLLATTPAIHAAAADHLRPRAVEALGKPIR